MAARSCASCGRKFGEGPACPTCGAPVASAATTVANPFAYASRTLSNPFARVIPSEGATPAAATNTPSASASPPPVTGSAPAPTDVLHTREVPRIESIPTDTLPAEAAVEPAGTQGATDDADTDVVEMPYSPGQMVDELRDLAARLERANAPRDAALLYRVLSHLLGAR